MEIEGTQVEGFVVRPGDKLIIQADPHSSMETFVRFKEQLDRLLSPLGVEYVAIATEQILIVRDGGSR